MVPNQPDYIRQVLSAEGIRRTTAQLHVDKVGEAHGRNAVEFETFARHSLHLIHQYQVNRNARFYEFSVFGVE